MVPHSDYVEAWIEEAKRYKQAAENIIGACQALIVVQTSSARKGHGFLSGLFGLRWFLLVLLGRRLRGLPRV